MSLKTKSPSLSQVLELAPGQQIPVPVQKQAHRLASLANIRLGWRRDPGVKVKEFYSFTLNGTTYVKRTRSTQP